MTMLVQLAAASLLLSGYDFVPIVNRPQSTFERLKFQGVSRQFAEPSCATASIATIIRLQYGETLDEAGLWLGYIATLSEARQRKAFADGLSIGDIDRILAENGFVAAAFRIDLLELDRAGRPAIVYLERSGVAPFRHFAVFDRLDGNTVQLLDPARGKRRIHISEFRRYWNGVAVFVDRK
jgi:predicted double-glycine peptidase